MQEHDRNTLLDRAERCRTLLEEVDGLLSEMNAMRADLQIRLNSIMGEIGIGESEADAVVPASKPRARVNKGLKRFLYQTLKTQGPLHLSDLLERCESAGFEFKGPDKKTRMSMTMSRDRTMFSSNGEGIWFVEKEEGAIDDSDGSAAETELDARIVQLREYQ